MAEARAGGHSMSVSLKLTDNATVVVAYLTLRPTGPAEFLSQAERSDGRSASKRLEARLLRGSRGDSAVGGSGRCHSKKRREH